MTKSETSTNDPLRHYTQVSNANATDVMKQRAREFWQGYRVSTAVDLSDDALNTLVAFARSEVARVETATIGYIATDDSGNRYMVTADGGKQVL